VTERAINTCEIVDDRTCWGEKSVGKTTCYRCGLPVCVECSKIVKGRTVVKRGKFRIVFRYIRVCANCIDEETRNERRLLKKDLSK
jgi:hypothetical protein